MEAERRKLLSVIRKAVQTAKIRESRMNMLCGDDWLRKLRLLPVKVLRNKFKYVVGNCSLRTLRAMQKKGVPSADPEVLSFTNNGLRRRGDAAIEPLSVLETADTSTRAAADADNSAGPSVNFSVEDVQIGRGTTHVSVESEKRQFYQRFQTEGVEYAIKIKDLPSDASINDWLQRARVAI